MFMPGPDGPHLFGVIRTPLAPIRRSAPRHPKRTTIRSFPVSSVSGGSSSCREEESHALTQQGFGRTGWLSHRCRVEHPACKCPDAVALAVRDDDAVSLHVRAADARPRAAARDHADAVLPHARREVEPAGALLRGVVPDQLRDRCSDRARAGVRVRDELVVVLEVRRRRVRRAARHRGTRSIHARVDVHRPLDLRPRASFAATPPRDDLPGLARHVALGLLHHRRELVDAAPGRLPDQQVDRNGAGDRHRDDHVPEIRALRLRARDPRGLPDRWIRRARRLGVASPPRPQRRRVPGGSQARHPGW